MNAYVVRKKTFGESDLIVDFFLESGELRTGFARSARRSKKRFPHQFHIAGKYDLRWFRQPAEEGITGLQSAEIIEYYPEIGSDIEKLTRWSLALEWIRIEEEADSQLFRRLNLLAKSLGAAGSLNTFFEFFYDELVRHGSSPLFEECVICHQEIDPKPELIDFHSSEGGFCHRSCAKGVRLEESAIQFLLGNRSIALNTADVKCLDLAILPLLQSQLGRDLKSHQFLAQL